MSVILITGASSGIGKATALKLLAKGHTVYGAARRTDRMTELEEFGGTALRMDVCNEGEMQLVVEQVIKEQGRIDVLVNNAGYAIYGAMEDTSLADARTQFEVNLFGLARLTQLVLPHMRRQGSGKIINMSSMGGKMYTPLGSWYHATKHALEGWSDCLRLELRPFSIDVVIIEPGIIKTEFDEVMLEPMIERSGSGAYANLAHRMKKGALEMYNKRGSKPEVIADLVSKAVMANRPKTRYRGGSLSRISVFVRTYFGDRVWDWMIMNAG